MLLDNIIENLPISKNKKTIIFVRHAEREDSKGKLLTDIGIQNSEKFGTELSKFNPSIKIYTAPELRCVQTAEIINQKISAMERDIIISNKLANLQIKNNELYKKLYSETNFIYKEIYLKWKNGCYYDALFSPNELFDRTMNFINSTSENNCITLYISQSGTIANIGFALKKLNYEDSENSWINFLDGFTMNL